MTSKERHQARYLRRQEKRERNKAKVACECDDFDEVFPYSKIYKAYKKCCRNVGWKASTQLYKANATYNVYLAYKKLKDGTFKSDGFYEFDLPERGKVRHIKSVTMRERVVQRCLCDYSLTPMTSRVLIYDNGASSKNKGYDFAIKRLEKQVHHFYNVYHTNLGYILLYDFSKFFDSLKHDLLKGILHGIYKNEKIKNLVFHFIDMFGNRGLGLGSQISQNLALISVNRLDHYVKEFLRIKGYGRYMDDGYLIHLDKEYLQKCLNDIKRISYELGVVLNTRKTRIARLDKGFTFLKIRFFLLSTGKLIEKVYPPSVTRMRRRLKKFKRLYDEGKMSLFDIKQSYQSWESHIKKRNSYRTRQSMRKLFKSLFGGYDVQNTKK